MDAAMSARLLHLACKRDATRCARLLLDGCASIEPAPVDARDPISRTPLHVAAEEGAHGCIHVLLDHKARTDLTLVVEGRSLLPLDLAMLARIDIEWPLSNASSEDVVAALQGQVNDESWAIWRLADKTSDAWRAGNTETSGEGGVGTGGVPVGFLVKFRVDRTRAEILSKLKILLMLLLLYSTTGLLSLFAATVLEVSLISEAPRIITAIYILQRLISYLVLKPAKWWLSEESWVKKSLAYVCFGTNCLASLCFSTSLFDFMSLRESILVPALIISVIPYFAYCFYKGQPITLRGLVVSTAYGLVYLFKADEEGRLFVPGMKPKAAFVGAAVTIWSMLDDLNNVKDVLDANFVKNAFHLYQEVSLDGARHLAATFICTIIVSS